MGRRRLGQNKQKRVVSISLDQDLVHKFDQTLGNYTRSGRLEKLIIQYLQSNQTKISEFQRHSYECLDCGRSWHQSRFGGDYMICGGKNGCYQMNIIYKGVLGEEE